MATLDQYRLGAHANDRGSGAAGFLQGGYFQSGECFRFRNIRSY